MRTEIHSVHTPVMKRHIARVTPLNIDLVLEYAQKPAAPPALIVPPASLLAHPLAAQSDTLPKCAAPDQLAARLHALSRAKIVPVDLSPDPAALSKEAGFETYIVKKSLVDSVMSLLPADQTVRMSSVNC